MQAVLKKKKRKMLKDKAYLEKRKKLKMLVEGDTYEIPNEQELFSLKKVARVKDRGNMDIKKVLESENNKDESSNDNDEDFTSDDDNDDSEYENFCVIIFFLLPGPYWKVSV